MVSAASKNVSVFLGNFSSDVHLANYGVDAAFRKLATAESFGIDAVLLRQVASCC